MFSTKSNSKICCDRIYSNWDRIFFFQVLLCKADDFIKIICLRPWMVNFIIFTSVFFSTFIYRQREFICNSCIHINELSLKINLIVLTKILSWIYHTIGPFNEVWAQNLNLNACCSHNKWLNTIIITYFIIVLQYIATIYWIWNDDDPEKREFHPLFVVFGMKKRRKIQSKFSKIVHSIY